MTRILAVANQKGGVGKTTTALNLGMALAQKQCRVLLVDLDPQASLSLSLGVDPYRVERSAYSLLMLPEMSTVRILKPLTSTLALIPSSVDLANAAIKMVQTGLALERLRAALRQSRVDFDYIVIDTPPGLNVLTVSGLLAADEVFIPAQCNHTAMHGIRATQEVVKRIRENMEHPSLRVGGVLPTFFDPGAIYAQQILDDLKALLPGILFTTVIPYDPNIADAPYKGKVVIDYAPDSPGARAYHALVEEVLAR